MICTRCKEDAFPVRLLVSEDDVICECYDCFGRRKIRNVAAILFVGVAMLAAMAVVLV